MSLHLFPFLVCSWVFSRCFASNAKKKSQQLLLKNVVLWQMLSSGNNQQFKWRSQPFIHGKHPAGNIMMSFSILMSGFNISQIFLMFKHMGVLAISLRTYFAQQKTFLFPVIFMHWEKHRAAFVEQVKCVQDAQCSADGLFDSMGHNSKYGVYTTYCNSILKLLHFELLQVL